MKDRIEGIVDAERFNMTSLRNAAWPLLSIHPRIASVYPTLIKHFDRTVDLLANAIFRHVFLLEVVKTPKIETTKFRCRWFDELTNDRDPRCCSFDECLEIASDLFEELSNGWLATEDHATAVTLCFQHGLLPYEMPLDYVNRPLPNTPGRIHVRGNLVWKCTDTMLRTLKLRQFLTSEESPDAEFFRRVLSDKIQVKTYLTDRVLTGGYKTNREKRWEVHPYSVHFALRQTCMEIEYKLIEQLCTFDGFPDRSRESLETRGILPPNLPVFRCPITQDKMCFNAFRKQLLNPIAGKSDFQVGHLNPLKLDDPGAIASGHTAENISWVSADGNRVQGSMSLAGVRALIRRVSQNYDELGID